jgi:hypothetical protein
MHRAAPRRARAASVASVLEIAFAAAASPTRGRRRPMMSTMKSPAATPGRRPRRARKTLAALAATAVLGLGVTPAALADRERSGDGDDPDAPALVASPRELRKMKKHLDRLYRGMKVEHVFSDDAGREVACVTLASQPALRHRKLRKHQIQLLPGQEIAAGKDERADERKDPPGDETAGYAGELRGDADAQGRKRACPSATVPIRLLTLDDLARFPTLEAFLAKIPGGKPDDDEAKPEENVGPTDLHQYAYVRDYVDNWGAEAVFNVWSPYVQRSNEFSLSQMWVVRGSGSSRETIEAGWQVYRQKYGDWRAHLFLYFTPDNYGSGGCYNLDCSGFVQVASNVYIAGGFTNYSSEGGSQYVFKLLWVRDPANGNWWLKYRNTWVGYYPSELFDSAGLKNKSDKLSYGGEIIDRQTDGKHTRTDMGSGGFPGAGFGFTAYQRSLRYVDLTYTYRKHDGLFEARDDANCYDVDLKSSSGSWGDYFWFGGEGYDSVSCQ